MSIYNTPTFIEKAKAVHLNLYDYSSAVYKSSHSPLEIICNTHGSFWQRPDKHWHGQGCPKCGIEKVQAKRRTTTEKFIGYADIKHKKLYDYSEVIYFKAHSKVKLICKEHGAFWQTPASHLTGRGCPKCNTIRMILKLSSNTEDFIIKSNKKHESLFDYSAVQYKNSQTKVEIICPKPKHGAFWQSPNDHLSGYGCPICNSSKGELAIRRLLIDKNIEFISQFKIKDCKNKIALPFDFAIFDKENRLIGLIEYQGIQHFKPILRFGNEIALAKTQINDEIKFTYCKKNKIPLLRVIFLIFKQTCII